MKCWKCGTDSPLKDWKIASVPCDSSSCSEKTGRECPNCGQKMPRTWLDGQMEWRKSEFYRP